MVWIGSSRYLGSEFHVIGLVSATEKARRPYELKRKNGTTNWWLAAEWRWCLEEVAETGVQCAARYRAAVPSRQRCISIHDALRCIKPVELRMYQLLQTGVELPGTSNHMSCRVQQLLQLVSDSLWSLGENDTAVVDSRHHKDVHQCHSRLRTKCTRDVSKLTKMVEASRTDLRDVLLEAEVGWELNSQ